MGPYSEIRSLQRSWSGDEVVLGYSGPAQGLVSVREEGKVDGYTLKKGTVCVDGGQGGSEASARSGPPREPPPLEARGGPGPDSSSEPPEGTHFANTFTLDFWPPKLYKNPFLLPEAPQFVFIHYRSRGK